jgi:ribosomal protein S18 acetylase RimI-like enzyme
MEKTDTFQYPKNPLPDGFSFSSYKAGFESQWAKLQYEVEHTDSLEEAEMVFQREFVGNTGAESIEKPERSPNFQALLDKMVFVLDQDGNMAGTGALWDGDVFGEVHQRLHWIAVAPQYQGKGIAKAIVSKLLDIYNQLGFSGYIYLTSQTWSYRALNIYFKFGFKPYMGGKPRNWVSANLTSGNYEPWDYAEKNIEAWNMINEKIRQHTGG